MRTERAGAGLEDHGISTEGGAGTLAPSDRVSRGLSAAIHDHRLRPGTKLGEDEVAAHFGVSRTVVRAALIALSHDRLVRIERNRGAFVAQPTQREAREVFEARRMLEPRTARQAARRAGPEDIARLARHLDSEHAAMDRGELGHALRLSGRFHLEIARIADQRIVAELVESLIARSSLVIALYLQRRTTLCESHAHHALLAALAAGDGDGAETLMHRHLEDLFASLDLNAAGGSAAEVDGAG